MLVSKHKVETTCSVEKELVSLSGFNLLKKDRFNRIDFH